MDDDDEIIAVIFVLGMMIGAIVVLALDHVFIANNTGEKFCKSYGYEFDNALVDDDWSFKFVCKDPNSTRKIDGIGILGDDGG